MAFRVAERVYAEAASVAEVESAKLLMKSAHVEFAWQCKRIYDLDNYGTVVMDKGWNHLNSINRGADGAVNSDKSRSVPSVPGTMEAMTLALGHMMQVLSRPLLHMLSRHLTNFCPSRMMQLLGVRRMHRGLAPPLSQLESPRLGHRMQLRARPLLQLLPRLGIIIVTQLHQLESSRPLRPQMPRRLQQARRSM